MTFAFFFLSFLLAQFFPGPTPSPTPSPSPSPTAEPLRVNTRVENNEQAPVHLFRASLQNARNFQYVQCISFRNVSAKVATDVDLSFVVTSYRGDVEAQWGQLDKGTFTPPINIDNHCWYGRLWPKHVVRRMSSQVVRVKRVDFADGTSWQPGGVFIPHVLGWMVHVYPYETDPKLIWSTDDDDKGHDNMDHDAMPGMKMN